MTATADLAVNQNKCTLKSLLDSQHIAWILQLNSSGFLGFFPRILNLLSCTCLQTILTIFITETNVPSQAEKPVSHCLSTSCFLRRVVTLLLFTPKLSFSQRKKNDEILSHLVSGNHPPTQEGKPGTFQTVPAPQKDT